MQITEVEFDGFQFRRIVKEWSLHEPVVVWMEARHITDEFVSITDRERIYNLEQRYHNEEEN